MTRETAEPLYPALDAAETAEMNATLVAVIALRHPGLTPAQVADLTDAIAQQTRHLEALHRFPLTNADEPAFVRSPLGGSR
jgi:hypothetical protein